MASAEYDHTDAEDLRELYHERGLSTRDIAEVCGVSHGSVYHQLKQHDIERIEYHNPDDAPYKDADTLRRWYWDEGLSCGEIGERAGVDRGTIHKWMKKLDVPRRTAYNDRKYVTQNTDKDGYEVWTHYTDTGRRVSVHRLLAVSEYGFDAVVGKDVHHINNIPWDNRHENITLLSREEHARRHGFERRDEQRELLRELRESGKLAPES